MPPNRDTRGNDFGPQARVFDIEPCYRRCNIHHGGRNFGDIVIGDGPEGLYKLSPAPVGMRAVARVFA
jgi:hypothetical protein